MSAGDADEVDEIELLLPWHAAGTLSRRDMERVEAALAGDPELARRYELVREELAQTVNLNESLGAPSPRVMAALFAKIDAEPARSPTISANLGSRIAEFFASLSPRTLAWSASAAALAILLQAGVIAGVMLKEKSVAGYQTASAPSPTAGAGTEVLIRFQPQASVAAITQFLETNKLRVADGPTAGGLYRVRIAEMKLSRADRTRIIKTLQIDPVVGFIAAPE